MALKDDTILETIERRSPFAQSEVARNITVLTSGFDIPYRFLRVPSGQSVYALPLNPPAQLSVWKDPSDSQPSGALRLRASADTTADFLLFLLR